MFGNSRWKVNNTTTANTDFTLVYPGSIVGSSYQFVIDPNYEVDVMLAVDINGVTGYGSFFYAPYVNNFIRALGINILRAWPRARLGLITQGGGNTEASLFYTEEKTLQQYTEAQIETWTVTMYGPYGGGAYPYYTKSRGLDALKTGAESGSFGWRSAAPGRKKFIINMNRWYPYDRNEQTGITNTTKAEARNACINNQIWPVWIALNNYSAIYNLGYGSSLVGYYAFNPPYPQWDIDGYINLNTLIPETLGAIYSGIVN